MGRQARFKKQKRRNRTALKEVIGTDLLTWKEKLIQGETSGLYSLTNEQAYCKMSGDRASMTVNEFEHKLQTDIDKNFKVVFNEKKSPNEYTIQGHSIYYYVEPWDSYIKVMNVGKNDDRTLPAESVGRIVKYQGEGYDRHGNLDEEAILYRGWVAAYEGCKYAYERWEIDGISPAMTINPKEILGLKQAFSVVGFKEDFNKAKGNMNTILATPIEEPKDDLQTEEAISEETPLEESEDTPKQEETKAQTEEGLEESQNEVE